MTLDELDRELGRVGIGGRRRARILAEAADHLAEGDPERFGDPREIAQTFADELATAGVTRSAFRAFAALAAAGLGFAAAWLLVVPRRRVDRPDRRAGAAARDRGRRRDARLLAGLARRRPARAACRRCGFGASAPRPRPRSRCS